MNDIDSRINQLAFIGFGEAATAFASGWGAARPGRITAFDIRADPQMRARFAQHDVIGQTDLGGALAGTDAVFSLVTADQALTAARAAASSLPAGAIWFDGNSCAPGSKRAAAQVIEAAGGRYVDMAIMAPVHPKRHHVPLLVSGPHADAACAVLRTLGMKPAVAGAHVGQASSIKMIRSVMIKGIEALTAECFLAARRAGVDQSVLSSLEASDPGMEWRTRGAYNLERMMAHGVRRAAEMREVARTLHELGLDGGMSRAAADWQDRIGALGLAPEDGDLASRADHLLSRL